MVMFQGPVLGSLADFDEEDGYEEDEMVCRIGIGSDIDNNGLSNSINGGSDSVTTRSVNFRLLQAPHRRDAALIDLDSGGGCGESDGLADLPMLPRPKSSYMSSSTLYTPTLESRGLPHSMSHCSSGYHSFADDTMYEKSIESVSNPFGSGVSSLAAHHPGVVFRRKKNNRNNLELKSLNNRMSLQETTGNSGHSEDDGSIQETGSLPVSRPLTQRARSLDRATRTANNLNAHRNENAKPANWQPQIDSIKEVVVPASPAQRRAWALSPVKTGRSTSSYDWRLAMLVFGGREQGGTSVYKQPISVWKLYV